jgi:hypothetical protein
MIIENSKYSGTCGRCQKPYKIGARIWWERGSDTLHAECADPEERGENMRSLLEAECLADRLDFSLPGEPYPRILANVKHSSGDATTSKPKAKAKPPKLF